MNTTTAAEIVTAALHIVFSEHDVDQVDRFFAADFVQHSPYTPAGGRDELRQWWATIVEAMPDVTTSVEQVVAADHRVAVFRVVEGTIVRDVPSLGIRGTGEHVTFRVADIFEVGGNKITAHWEIADTGSLVHLAASQTQ